MRLPPSVTPGLLQQLLNNAPAAPPAVRQRLLWLQDYATGGSVANTCRTFGISRSTFYRWLKRFDPADLRSLEDVALPVRPAARQSRPLSAVPSLRGHGPPAGTVLPARRASARSPVWTAALVTSMAFNLLFPASVVLTAAAEGLSARPAAANTSLPAAAVPGGAERLQAE